MSIPSSLRKIIFTFKKLPGIGQRSAERIVFHLLRNRVLQEELIDSLEELRDKLSLCSECYGITEEDPCVICRDPRRNSSILCVVERPQDILFLETLSIFKGKYFSIGGVISPVDGVKPEDLHIDELLERVKRDHLEEVILAMNPTVEGDATAYYIAEQLKACGVKVTRIARGMPTGVDISFVDARTLKEAFTGRRNLL